MGRRCFFRCLDQQDVLTRSDWIGRLSANPDWLLDRLQLLLLLLLLLDLLLLLLLLLNEGRHRGSLTLVRLALI